MTKRFFSLLLLLPFCSFAEYDFSSLAQESSLQRLLALVPEIAKDSTLQELVSLAPQLAKDSTLQQIATLAPEFAKDSTLQQIVSLVSDLAKDSTLQQLVTLAPEFAKDSTLQQLVTLAPEFAKDSTLQELVTLAPEFAKDSTLQSISQQLNTFDGNNSSYLDLIYNQLLSVSVPLNIIHPSLVSLVNENQQQTTSLNNILNVDNQLLSILEDIQSAISSIDFTCDCDCGGGGSGSGSGSGEGGGDGGEGGGGADFNRTVENYLSDFNVYLEMMTEKLAQESTLTDFYNFMHGSVGLNLGSDLSAVRVALGDTIGSDINDIEKSVGDTLGQDVTSIMNYVDTIKTGLHPILNFYSDTSKLYDDQEWKEFRDLFFKKTFVVPSRSYGYGTISVNGVYSTVQVSGTSRTGFASSVMYGFTELFSSLGYVSQNTARTGKFIYDFLSPLSPTGTGFLNYSGFSHSYANIGFESNSVPEEVQLDYSKMDFFNASIKLLSDGNKINGAATMFLKHIRERLPDLSTKDTKSDEERIEQSIQDSSDRLDSLKQSFEFTEITFKDSSEYFDADSFLSSLKDSYCPHAIVIRIPGFMGFDEQVVSILTSDIQPFLDVSRAVFGTVYFVILAGFVWFVFRLFVPVLSRFSKVLATVLNW